MREPITINGKLYRQLFWESDGFYGMRESFLSRVFDRFLSLWCGWDWMREQVRLDRQACGIPPNVIGPVWCLDWWCGLPIRAIKWRCVNLLEIASRSLV